MSQNLGFHLRQDERGDWLYCEDGEERAATLPERVLWKELKATPAQAQQAKGDPKLLAILSAPMTLQEAYGEGWCDRKQFKNFDEAWQHSTTRYKAKPEAQPLTDEQFKQAMRECFNIDLHTADYADDIVLFRWVERACAEAWGVKLAGIGASGEASNG